MKFAFAALSRINGGFHVCAGRLVATAVGWGSTAAGRTKPMGTPSGGGPGEGEPTGLAGRLGGTRTTGAMAAGGGGEAGWGPAAGKWGLRSGEPDVRGTPGDIAEGGPGGRIIGVTVLASAARGGGKGAASGGSVRSRDLLRARSFRRRVDPFSLDFDLERLGIFSCVLNY